jgi:hypothetical protein
MQNAPINKTNKTELPSKRTRTEICDKDKQKSKHRTYISSIIILQFLNPENPPHPQASRRQANQKLEHLGVLALLESEMLEGWPGTKHVWQLGETI